MDPRSLIAGTLLWIPLAIESLWLLTVGLVPIVFAPPDLMLYPDVPKVVLLRMLTGLMGLLWVMEWSLKPQTGAERAEGTLRERFLKWLKESPAHWILVAATSFLIVNLISTLLSPSISVSLWGSNPGRDGYGLYNSFSYYLLFLVIATRLRDRKQLWRLLIVISAAVTVAALYGILQHFQISIFDVGISGERVTSTFGNALFAGSFFTVALPISTGLALAHITRRTSATVGAFWAVVLSVGVLGLMFTFSRGPLASLSAALFMWVVLVRVTMGNRVFLNAVALLGAVAILIAGQFFGPSLFRSLGRSVDAFTVNRVSESFAGNADTTLKGEEPLSPDNVDGSKNAFNADDVSAITPKSPNEIWQGETFPSANAKGGPEDSPPKQSTLNNIEVGEQGDPLTANPSAGGGDTIIDAFYDASESLRAEEIIGGFASGSFGGRIPLWKKSLAVALERPWFDPQQRGSIVVRHLFGYGPEMLVYALPLHWDPDSNEAVNASPHNYLLQLLVELGVLGLLSYTVLIGAILIGSLRLFISKPATLSGIDILIFGALVAAIVARVTDQMTGVARVSDTTLFWAVAGALTAMFFMARSESNDVEVKKQVANPGPNYWKIGIATMFVIVAFMVVWQKNVPYAEAAYLGNKSIEAYENEDLTSSLDLMDGAIFRGPDVHDYYNLRSRMMNSFGTRDESDEIEIASEQYAYDKLALKANPLSHTAKAYLASSAMRLYQYGDKSKGDESLQHLRELVLMLPGFAPVYRQLATAHLILEEPKEAISVIDEFLEFTGGKGDSIWTGKDLRNAAAEQIKGFQTSKLSQP